MEMLTVLPWHPFLWNGPSLSLQRSSKRPSLSLAKVSRKLVANLEKGQNLRGRPHLCRGRGALHSEVSFSSCSQFICQPFLTRNMQQNCESQKTCYAEDPYWYFTDTYNSFMLHSKSFCKAIHLTMKKKSKAYLVSTFLKMDWCKTIISVGMEEKEQ